MGSRVGASPASGAGPQARSSDPSYEHTFVRWVERNPPPPEIASGPCHLLPMHSSHASWPKHQPRRTSEFDPMTRRTRPKAVIAFVVVVLLFAACSSKSPSAAKTTTTTAAAAATTPPATTPPTSPPATVPPTSPPTTKAPAPTGPTLTQQQQSAVASAKQYLGLGSGFSQQGLIDQLDSSAGGGYSVNDATVAVDSLNENWNAQAVLSAKGYLQTSPFSCADLINQLDSSAGGQFTVAQATYGAQQAQQGC